MLQKILDRLFPQWEAVAIDRYQTEYTVGGKRTGEIADHMVAFELGRGGRRRARVVKSAAPLSAERHGGIIAHSSEWEAFGLLPDTAKRLPGRGKAKLISFPGGKAS